MKDLNAPRFLVYALSQALRHPRKPIVYLYCPECRVSLPGNAEECPRCGREAKNSPEVRQESPIPWWGSVLVIVIGITCWVVSGWLQTKGLDEAGRALVYIPLGSLFGMSLRK